MASIDGINTANAYNPFNSARVRFAEFTLMPIIDMKNTQLENLMRTDPDSPEFTKMQQMLTELNEIIRRLLSVLQDLNDQAAEERKIANENNKKVWQV